MRRTYIFCQLVVAVHYLFFSAMSGQCGEPVKVLINIIEEPQTVTSVGTEAGTSVKIVSIDQGGEAKAPPIHSRKAEALLARHLLQANYQVLTSDELTTSSWLGSLNHSK